MIIVVSDTSPLNYLVLIQAAGVLPRIFGQVYAPLAVIDELKHPAGPEAVRQWASAPPEWLIVQEPSRVTPVPRLDPGEMAAIALAEELRADAILIDEQAGRQVARERGLQVVGTLGVLSRAASLDLIDLPQAIAHLKATNFHVRDALLEELLQEDRERRQAREQKPYNGPRPTPLK